MLNKYRGRKRKSGMREACRGGVNSELSSAAAGGWALEETGAEAVSDLAPQLQMVLEVERWLWRVSERPREPKGEATERPRQSPQLLEQESGYNAAWRS